MEGFFKPAAVASTEGLCDAGSSWPPVFRIITVKLDRVRSIYRRIHGV